MPTMRDLGMVVGIHVGGVLCIVYPQADRLTEQTTKD